LIPKGDRSGRCGVEPTPLERGLRALLAKWKQALIPTKGSISAVLYSRDHGDLLISTDKQTAIVYNFTERKTLYQRKQGSYSRKEIRFAACERPCATDGGRAMGEA